MTPSITSLTATADDHRIARLAAIAIGLTMVEAALPSPIPGVKPGLANIVVLIVLLRYGLNAAAWVAVLRVLAASLLMGSFLTPGFTLSLGGALASIAALSVTSRLPSAWFGPVTHSVVAAFAHIAGQLTVVFVWLIPHAGIRYLIPIFAGSALLFGLVNGLIAAKLLQAEPETAERALAA